MVYTLSFTPHINPVRSHFTKRLNKLPKFSHQLMVKQKPEPRWTMPSTKALIPHQVAHQGEREIPPDEGATWSKVPPPNQPASPDLQGLWNWLLHDGFSRKEPTWRHGETQRTCWPTFSPLPAHQAQGKCDETPVLRGEKESRS